MFNLPSNKLTPMEIDALKEIGNVGAGNASVKLSDLASEKVALELTELEVLAADQFMQKYKSEEEHKIVSIFLKVVGDIFGTVVILFSDKFAMSLVDLINRRTIGATQEITAANEEEFKVVGTSLSEAYLNSLGDFLGIVLREAGANVHVNKQDIIFNSMLRQITPALVDDVLLVKTKFTIERYGLSGEFLLLFGIKSLDRLRKIINTKFW